MHTPITSGNEALLRALNVMKSLQTILDGLVADGIIQSDEEIDDAVDDARKVDEAGMAWLEANAPKCSCCKEAFAFQRQPRRPTHCSWCGYDHETGAVSVLVPAATTDPTKID